MNLRSIRLPLLLLTLALAAVPAVAQTTKPANPAGIEIAANEAFGAGRYAVALPMLQNLADKYKEAPDKLGPVQEKINVCLKQISANATIAQPVDPNAVDIPTAAETRKKHVKPEPGHVYDLSIKELGNFDYDADKGGNIPADVKALAGSKVRLHGFMIPMDQADRITKFALVPSLFACCFGQPPQIQHTIVVNCPEGKAVSYYPDEISVEGNLKVDEKKEDGFIVSVFEMDVTSVKPTAK